MSTSAAAKLAILVAGSSGLALLSRESLLSPKAHGFYRFFGWECILTLFVLNVRFWFVNPLSISQLVSWVFLVASAYLVISAVGLLRRQGRPDRSRQDVPLVGFERTTGLVTEGTSGEIRHPLYSYLLFLAWGIFLEKPGNLQGGLAALATVFLLATARAEEKESLAFFGAEYKVYMARTKRFAPFIF